MITKTTFKAAVLIVLLSLTARAQTAEKKSLTGGAVPDSAAAQSVDSTLAGADSSLILGKGFSAMDYMTRREKFNYPRTSRNDPFNFPMGKEVPSDVFGPVINELLLTGVLYTPYGPKIAIMSTPEGQSFLVHEGDMLGIAEVVLIDRKQVTFRISEFGQVRDIVIELKPLSEEENAESAEAAGAQRRQGESREYDETGGPRPRRPR